MSELRSVGSGQESSERRFLTIEFIDLVGFTDMAEQMDPEELGVLLRRYQRLALSVMERYGGFVARVIGDGILVYFGYPAAHENDAERALRAALTLQKGLRELDTEVLGRTLPQLQARIGIHSGLVLIAQEFMSGGTSDHGVVGEAVNLAARLQGEAPPGGIATSRETLDLIEGLFECRSLGTKPIKGLTRLVEVYEVMRAMPGTRRSEARLRRGAANLVGRDGAIDSVVSCWELAKRESRCVTVEIVADAGLGKTRLVLEICARPEFAEAVVFQTHCHEIFASTPLYSVASFFWDRIGLTADDDAVARLQKISGYLDKLGRSSDENREIVASLVGVAVPGAGEASAETPQILKRRQYQFVVSVVEATARSRPLVLWIEDAHWFDPSSAELLLDIAAAAAGLPVLMLLTRRPFPKGPALPVIHQSVALDHLGPEQCLQLARSVVGASALSDELIAKAVEAAEGVPLFLEQLVISLIEEQSQASVPNRRLGGVPLMLAEMLSERLDRRPGARRVAQAAACIGRSFMPDFLFALLKDDAAQVKERLESLVDAEILLPRRYGAEIRYEFRHALLQRMAHESMVQSERRAMHGRIVEVLGEFEGGSPTIPEVQAYHLTEAGAFDKAIGAWLKAGMSAARRSAHVEAIDHNRKGLALLERIADPATRNQFELNLQVSLMGALLAAQSATSPALATCCERGLVLCEEANAASMVFPFAFGQFTFVNCRGHNQEAIALANLFLGRAQEAGRDSERVIGYRMLGQALLAGGDPAGAKEALGKSLTLYDHERDVATTDMYGQNTEVHSKSILSLAEFCLGDIDAALAIGTDALRTADRLRHPHSTAIPMVYVGGWVFGLCDAAVQMMAQAKHLLALAEQHRLHGFRVHAAAHIGWGLAQVGELAQGVEMIKKAIAAFDAVEFRMAQAGHLANLADAQRRLGHFDDAEANCERALQLLPASSSWLEPEVRRVQAMLAVDMAPADPDRADALFRGAAQCAREFGFPVFERRCLASHEAFLKTRGQRDAGVDARLTDLAHLSDLRARVARAMEAVAHA